MSELGETTFEDFFINYPVNALSDVIGLIITIVTTPEYLIYTLFIIGIGVAVIWYKKEGQAKKDQFKNKRKRRG